MGRVIGTGGLDLLILNNQHAKFGACRSGGSVDEMFLICHHVAI